MYRCVCVHKCTHHVQTLLFSRSNLVFSSSVLIQKQDIDGGGVVVLWCCGGDSKAGRCSCSEIRRSRGGLRLPNIKALCLFKNQALLLFNSKTLFWLKCKTLLVFKHKTLFLFKARALLLFRNKTLLLSIHCCQRSTVQYIVVNVQQCIALV